MAFSPDGKRIVTAGGSTRVWDAGNGNLLFDLDVTGIRSVAYSPDGKRIITGGYDGFLKVWDAKNGSYLFQFYAHQGDIKSLAFSSDGKKIFTCSSDKTIKIWDASVNDLEKSDIKGIGYRLLHTRPDSLRYQEGLDAATASKDSFAADFFIERLLSMPGQRTKDRLKERIDRFGNSQTIARTTFHRHEFANTFYDSDCIAALALAGDRLAQRLVAQERIREGKPALAVPLLTACMITRPRNAPPVEELLIAKAYLALNDRPQAERYYRAATEWLDRPRNPIRAAEVVTKSAINGWAALGEAFKPIDDPRHNTFDWESWHESDVFRAEVEAGLAKK